MLGKSLFMQNMSLNWAQLGMNVCISLLNFQKNYQVCVWMQCLQIEVQKEFLKN